MDGRKLLIAVLAAFLLGLGIGLVAGTRLLRAKEAPPASQTQTMRAADYWHWLAVV